jgi:hypothetical protein
MFLRDAQENVEALFESLGILLPEQVVQKDAHGVQAQGLRPAELLVYALGIESIRLPRFKFVYGRGWNVVAADEPGLMCVPIVRSLFSPTGCLRLRRECESQNEHNAGQEAFHQNFLSPFPIAMPS